MFLETEAWLLLLRACLRWSTMERPMIFLGCGGAEIFLVGRVGLGTGHICTPEGFRQGLYKRPGSY